MRWRYLRCVAWCLRWEDWLRNACHREFGQVSVVLKVIVSRIFGLKHEIQEALPNVKSGVEVDESGDLRVSVIEESVERSVFFAQEAEPCQACNPRPV